MKKLYIIFLLGLATAGRSQSNMNNNFSAQRISKTASFTTHGSIDKVFPLFGPFEEQKWAEGWSPVLVYPQQGKVQEGLVFKTKGHIPGEKENTWLINRYQPESHLIEYLVIAENRLLTITVQCGALADTATSATVTYTFTGLTEGGNMASGHILGRMYAENLHDWAEAINYYLKTGKTLLHH
jgi:hypothetical protein